jgi:hypothetical protein
MKKYRIRAENVASGKIKNITVKCFYIGNVIRKFAEHGWVVTKQYEI